MMNTSDKRLYIKSTVEAHKSGFLEIESDKAVDNIYHLFTTGTPLQISEPIEHLYYGWYYQYDKPDPIRMKYYYKLHKDNVHCMSNLFCYYRTKNKDNKLVKYADILGKFGNYHGHLYLAQKAEFNKDYVKADEYYQKAAETKDSDALFLYAEYFIRRDNEPLTIKYLQLAADAGNQTAKIQLAVAYRKKKDYESMKKELIGLEDNVDAVYILGSYYYTIERNFNLAKQYLQKAVDMGCIGAMVDLAYHYCHIERNCEKSEKYLLMAIELKNSLAMVELGKQYQYYMMDRENAVKYYEMAIETDNNCQAMLCLGVYYETEVQDYEKMKHYYNMVLTHGDTKFKAVAARNMMNYYSNIEKDEKLAAKYKECLHDTNREYYDRFNIGPTKYPEVWKLLGDEILRKF